MVHARPGLPSPPPPPTTTTTKAPTLPCLSPPAETGRASKQMEHNLGLLLLDFFR